MAKKRLVERIFSGIIGSGLSMVKGKVEETIEEIKHKVEVAINHAIKKFIVFLLLLIAMIFILAGLGKYLSETISSFNHGLGYVFVGGCLVLVAIIGRLFQSE